MSLSKSPIVSFTNGSSPYSISYESLNASPSVLNIHWKHGINALKESERKGKGRISIIVWGNVANVVE